MQSETIYRISIIILCLASFFLNYMTGGWEYHSDIVNAMEWHGFNSQIPHWLKLSIIGPLQVAALIMLSFNLIARNIFAILSLISLSISLFEGVAAYSAFEIFIVQIFYFSNGVILTLSFTTLSDKFRSPFIDKASQSSLSPENKT
ncbi:hypothetical protein E2650_03550 [Shewanella xiamenensis]|uniref:DoxX family protein n=1 Tax=Shewanella xiamenensis TaxID=332186 RepID=A0AAW6QT78_9GAMM|nr:hypothetical protein [Shewanella xiamenensis]MDG5898997.1 hypothetical protein [Shewanella xiamenensis]